MRINHTSRLFYKKYPYRILFTRSALIGDPDYHKGWTVHNCKTWLEDLGASYRIYSKVRHDKRRKPKADKVTVIASLFLTDKAIFETAVDKWKSNVDSITKPYDDAHVGVLKDNTTVVIRESYLYKKFKYIVTFRRHWKEEITDIIDWAKSNFNGRSDGPAIKMSFFGWNPRLYLVDDSDLLLIKLTWGDRIRDITVICTHAELEASKNSKP